MSKEIYCDFEGANVDESDCKTCYIRKIHGIMPDELDKCWYYGKIE